MRHGDRTMMRSRLLVSHDGFSLVEVMVALVVVSIGLLGIAKMQALALSSTGTAKMRSLASIEAASLASTLRADRNYWSAIAANLTVTVANSGSVSSAQNATLNAAPASHCTSVTTPCTSAQIAAQDLSDWAKTLIAVLPAGSAVIQCNIDATGTNPVGCRIQLTWNENVIALNTATNTSATTTQNKNALSAVSQTQYSLYVEP
jgi:type IV pilus assembly protein PilV